jgi:uncharacterized protein YecE (DUF72 family)
VKKPNLKIGCCGFPRPKTEYAAHFCVAEVQQTFYEPPRISTLERWRSSVPPDFEFTLKAWQLITHTAKSPTFRRLRTKLTPQEFAECGSFKNTPIVRNAWEKSRACADTLKARYILLQCPASFTPIPEHLKQMRDFFNGIDRGNLKLLWEPRGDWPRTLIKSLCEDLELIHAVDPFVSQTVSDDLTYFRLHGGKGFKHIYSDAELEALHEIVPSDKPAYVMFNNIAMLNDAQRFMRLLELDKKKQKV